MYFLLAKRRFDWFAVAFFSSCVYFLPGFFGYTSFFLWGEEQIANEAYLIMIVVEIMIWAGAFINDLIFDKIKDNVTEQRNTAVLYVIAGFAVIGFILMFLTTGAALFYEDKLEMMDELNRSAILYETAITIGAIMSFEYKKWTIFAFFCLLIMFDVYIGFRTSLGIVAISIFTLWFSKRGKIRLLINYWPQLLAGIVPVLFLLFYNQIRYAIKASDFELLTSLVTDSSTYAAMFTDSEPFITVSILNEVTIRHYFVGMEHFIGILYQFLLYSPELGLHARSFNALFQPELFGTTVQFGMANNIWAEMWSSGGWPLLLIFLVLFIFILRLFSTLTGRCNITLRAFVAVMAAYWAFYIHRNDLTFEIALEKRVLIVLGLSLLIATIVNSIKKRTVKSTTLFYG
jgi:hypothetical protein